MNYSLHYPSILFIYIGVFAGIILFLILLIREGIILVRQYKKLKSVKKLACAAAAFVCIILLAAFSVPYFKDIPNAVNNNYIIAAGTVVAHDSGGTQSQTRGITLETDEGERIKVTVNYTPMRTGERYEIICLPNTGIGSVIRKTEPIKLPAAAMTFFSELRDRKCMHLNHAFFIDCRH